MIVRRILLLTFLQVFLLVLGSLGDEGGYCTADSKSEDCKEPIIDRMSGNKERTFILVKPDGVHRGLVPEILGRFTRRGFKLVAMKMLQPTEEFAKQHYDDLKNKGFFGGLCKFFSSGPVVATVWEGKDVVKTGRVMLGETNPMDSKPGSIRGDYAIDIGRNVIHGSDSVESAQREIALWFKPEELIDWKPTLHSWVYE